MNNIKLEKVFDKIDERIEVLKSKDQDARDNDNQLRRSREAYLSRVDELEDLKLNLKRIFG